MKKQTFIAKIIISFSALFLVACTPFYKPANGLPHTLINTTFMPSPEMCLDGERYRLEVDADKNASIPAGRNIVVASNFISDDGSVMWHCRPVLGFMPQENIKYVGLIHFKGRVCKLQILRENTETASGLDWDKTMWNGACSPK